MSNTAAPTATAEMGSLQRSLQDWRDFWLTEAAFMLSRESRLLVLDLSEIPSSLNPIKLFGGDPEHDTAVQSLVDHWLAAMQQRMVERACHELNQVLLGESAGRTLTVKKAIPQLTEHALATQLRKAALSTDWRTAVPRIVWSSDGSSAVLDEFWAPLLNDACRITLEKARAHQL